MRGHNYQSRMKNCHVRFILTVDNEKSLREKKKSPFEIIDWFFLSRRDITSQRSGQYTNMDCGLRTTDYGLRTTDYGLRTTDYGLRTTDYGLRTTDYGLRTTDYGLRTTDYGLQTTDYGLRTTDWV